MLLYKHTQAASVELGSKGISWCAMHWLQGFWSPAHFHAIALVYAFSHDSLLAETEAIPPASADPTDVEDVENDPNDDAQPEDADSAPARKSRKTVLDSDVESEGEQAETGLGVNDSGEAEADAGSPVEEPDQAATAQDIDMAEAFGSDEEGVDV